MMFTLSCVFLIIILWFSYLLIIRGNYFAKNGKRKLELHPKDEQLRSEQLKSHTEGIYRDLELFFKLSLAIFGGVAYLVVQSGDIAPSLPIKLISWGMGIQLGAAILTAIFLAIHMDSKISRWSRKFSWWEPIKWGETWGLATGMFFSIYSYSIIRPDIITLIIDI